MTTYRKPDLGEVVCYPGWTLDQMLAVLVRRVKRENILVQTDLSGEVVVHTGMFENKRGSLCEPRGPLS